jgi:hypothetical protein
MADGHMSYNKPREVLGVKNISFHELNRRLLYRMP